MMSEETKIENGEDFAAMLEESFKTLNTGEKVKMCIRDRHYEVRVRGRLDNIPRLEEPMEIDGYAIRPARVVILEQDSESAKLRLTIHEGRNRQIRKMCEQCGLEAVSYTHLETACGISARPRRGFPPRPPAVW